MRSTDNSILSTESTDDPSNPQQTPVPAAGGEFHAGDCGAVCGVYVIIPLVVV